MSEVNIIELVDLNEQPTDSNPLELVVSLRKFGTWAKTECDDCITCNCGASINCYGKNQLGGQSYIAKMWIQQNFKR